MAIIFCGIVGSGEKILIFECVSFVFLLFRNVEEKEDPILILKTKVLAKSRDSVNPS
jgi:hypothetical protein